MDIQLLSKDDKTNKHVFLVKDCSDFFMNTIRRLIIEDVPTLAIEDVEFVDNSSALYDEMISLRLGLLPIKTDLKSYNLPKECKCEGKGCSQCQLNFTLKSGANGLIYSEELKSKDSKCKVVHDKTPVVKLLKGQSIELIATAKLGQGKDHMKWSPGNVFYKSYPVIEITKEAQDLQEASKICPKNVFDFKDSKLTVNEDNKHNCHLCNACVDLSKGAIKVEDSQKDFIMTIESWGQLEPKEMVDKAVDIFNQKLDDFQKNIK